MLEKFYMSENSVNLIELKDRLGYEPRSIYRLRDKALAKFTLSMYAVEHL